MNFKDEENKLKAAVSSVYGAAVTFVETKVIPALDEAEAEVVSLVLPILKAGEAQALADLKAGVVEFLQSAAADLSKSPSALAADMLNVWETEKPELIAVAKSVGSQVFEGVIGLLLAKLAA